MNNEWMCVNDTDVNVELVRYVGWPRRMDFSRRALLWPQREGATWEGTKSARRI